MAQTSDASSSGTSTQSVTWQQIGDWVKANPEMTIIGTVVAVFLLKLL